MGWKIEYTETARRQLNKLNKPVARRILDFFDERVAKQEDPRALGKMLRGPLGDLWRFRVGDYRAICDIQFSVTEAKASRILVLQVGHRREVYPIVSFCTPTRKLQQFQPHQLSLKEVASNCCSMPGIGQQQATTYV